MYSVVGCSECRNLWVVEGRPETTQCSRCRTRHRFEKLKAFAETDSSEAAARVRSSMLADRADDGEFVDPDEIDPDSVGMSDGEFLAASGLDAETVSDAGERATAASPSRQEAVRAALRELEEPTAEEVAARAAEHGVDREYVERALEKLRRRGEVTETGGCYRLL
ncbi:DUF5817 domain-containing protein [Natronomonas marina]|jgi:hypothetical protein|uniref:DUF5817 domain-containing protein n=1 Tax=Natronomonas marina TaxID=2961939 RepID=UPI0020CA02E3|nr:DUF5817 domain-containing protein [Natronomonas marina]